MINIHNLTIERSNVELTKDDFVSDQMVKWCPGCGAHAILSSVANVFPKIGYRKENFMLVSGIGCSSRFPYYMNTYGIHGIHGRAAAIASGVKVEIILSISYAGISMSTSCFSTTRFTDSPRGNIRQPHRWEV